MESITATGGKAVATNQSKPTTLLDERILELANNKPGPHSEEKSPLDASDVLPLMPMLPHPLLKALAVLRSGGREQINAAEEQRTMKHEAATDPLHKTSKRSAGGDKTHAEMPLPLTGKAGVEAPVIKSKTGAEAPVAVSKTGAEASLLNQLSPQQRVMPDVVQVNNPQPSLVRGSNLEKAYAEQVVVRKTEVSERKWREELVMPPLAGLQPVSHAPVQQAGDVPAVMSPRTPVLPQPAEVVNPLQSGLTYQFSRWGEGHTVTVVKNEGQIFTFRPSDTLVTQQLSQQWPSGNPEKWQLSDDGREKHQQRDRQQHEEDET
ncbi:hypothetical protein E5C26_20300 [Serratia proteamaculans]|uniref:SpaN/EivJ family type III secretion system needle length determinant n=1 Tax=Serratia proteamaculans TaxID=28151 RepID=UPI00107679CC|nr:type III secretion system needle length determinant, SpaN/EivJ family [Serratia proteamaculans]TFZ48684.1 hypothetical protein E5C26_20300 [Serratia proteamaculans]